MRHPPAEGGGGGGALSGIQEDARPPSPTDARVSSPTRSSSSPARSRSRSDARGSLGLGMRLAFAPHALASASHGGVTSGAGTARSGRSLAGSDVLEGAALAGDLAVPALHQEAPVPARLLMQLRGIGLGPAATGAVLGGLEQVGDGRGGEATDALK